MKFTVDQSLPPVLADYLREQGQEAVHVRELGLHVGPDSAIWRYAVTHRGVIVTKDEDYTRLLATTNADVRVVWVRLGNCSNGRLLDRFGAAWPRIAPQLRFGMRLIEVR